MISKLKPWLLIVSGWAAIIALSALTLLSMIYVSYHH